METKESNESTTKKMTPLSPKHINLFRWWMKQGGDLKGDALIAHMEYFFTEDGIEAIHTKAMKQGLYFIEYAPVILDRESRGTFQVQCEFYTGMIRANDNPVARISNDSEDSHV